MTAIDPQWETVDSWWHGFVQQQEEDLYALRDRFDDLDDRWARSECLFDQDPSAEDWTETSPQAGPLRGQEENWSQWLAHLCRSSATFTSELFDSADDTLPTSVRCERAYHDEELHDRRVDIEIRWPTQAISIEVKINDEAYGKTPQTAYLTELNNDSYEWQHYLLLPRAKLTALKDAFGSQVEQSAEGRSKIQPDGSEESRITVIYWDEVSHALRRVLLNGAGPTQHWTASAYVLTTLIEQQILRHYAGPSLDGYIEAAIGVSDIDRLQSIEPEAQLEYLDAVVEAADE